MMVIPHFIKMLGQYLKKKNTFYFIYKYSRGQFYNYMNWSQIKELYKKFC